MAIVLGYGALLCREHVGELCGPSGLRSFRRGQLAGYRRHWEVLYRNGCYAEGHYVSKEDGSFFPGGIAFLGVRPEADASLKVSEIDLDEEALARVDQEEFLYRRIDVSHSYHPDGGRSPKGPIWLYREAPEEFPGGWYHGDHCVVSREYHARVSAAAARMFPNDPLEFERSTEACPWPIAELVWQDRASLR